MKIEENIPQSSSNRKLPKKRQTSLPRKKRRKKFGRKRLKRQFDETRIGHFLKHEAMLEYGLIMATNEIEPSADLIEAVSYASKNPLFRKAKFRRSLIHYRKYGLYCGNPVKAKAKTELYYIRLRKNSVKRLL